MLLVFTFLGCFIFDVQDTPQVEWQCAHCCHLSLICSDLVMTAGCCYWSDPWCAVNVLHETHSEREISKSVQVGRKNILCFDRVSNILFCRSFHLDSFLCCTLWIARVRLNICHLIISEQIFKQSLLFLAFTLPLRGFDFSYILLTSRPH